MQMAYKALALRLCSASPRQHLSLQPRLSDFSLLCSSFANYESCRTTHIHYVLLECVSPLGVLFTRVIHHSERDARVGAI